MHHHSCVSRRQFFSQCGMGMGGLMLGGMLADSAQAGMEQLAVKSPHFPGRAKHVIHLFMNGGPSHVDTFDPKPILAKYAGCHCWLAQQCILQRAPCGLPHEHAHQ
jgi:hypothetical protein